MVLPLLHWISCGFSVEWFHWFENKRNFYLTERNQKKWQIPQKEVNWMTCYLLHAEATFPMMFAHSYMYEYASLPHLSIAVLNECLLNVISLRFTSLLLGESIRCPVLRRAAVFYLHLLVTHLLTDVFFLPFNNTIWSGAFHNWLLNGYWIAFFRAYSYIHLEFILSNYFKSLITCIHISVTDQLYKSKYFLLYIKLRNKRRALKRVIKSFLPKFHQTCQVFLFKLYYSIVSHLVEKHNAAPWIWNYCE